MYLGNASQARKTSLEAVLTSAFSHRRGIERSMGSDKIDYNCIQYNTIYKVQYIYIKRSIQLGFLLG